MGRVAKHRDCMNEKSRISRKAIKQNTNSNNFIPNNNKKDMLKSLIGKHDKGSGRNYEDSTH